MSKLLITVLLVGAIHINSHGMNPQTTPAPETPTKQESIAPCSEEERYKFAEAFFKRGCNYECMEKELEKLAADPEMDKAYLRTLLCANKDNRSDHFRIRVSYRDIKGPRKIGDQETCHSSPPAGDEDTPGPTSCYAYNIRIPFIQTAIAKKNVNFLKIFFGLYGRNGSTPIKFEIKGWETRHTHELDFDQMDATKDFDIAELLFRNTQRPLSMDVISRCHGLSFRPGCEVVRRVHQERKESELAAALRKEQEQRAREQSWRSIGK